MGKKMKLPFLFQSKNLDPKFSSAPPWPWPACRNVKTLSFRASNAQDDAFRAFNSSFLDPENTPPEDSFFTVSSSSRSHSTMSEDYGDPVETVIRSLQSDRLFFEPDHSSSLLSMPLETEKEAKPCSGIDEGICRGRLVYKESEILSMDSNNPYEDFRRSMEEMVEAHGLKDWQGLEGLLGCYLTINGKNNHGYIVGAFIDLLVNLSFATSSTISTTTTITSSSSSLSIHSNYSSPSSPLSLPSSSLTTPCLSSILDHGDDDDAMDNDDHHQHCHVPS